MEKKNHLHKKKKNEMIETSMSQKDKNDCIAPSNHHHNAHDECRHDDGYEAHHTILCCDIWIIHHHDHLLSSDPQTIIKYRH
jgi:hypothetical protein